MTTKTILAAAAATVLALPAAAQAHVTIQPRELPAGGFTVINVRVPNERDDASTTKVDVQLPDGFVFASYQPVPGWKVRLTREKADRPIEIEGERYEEQVARVTISGGRIAPGQFMDFPLSVRMPDGDAGTKLTFRALQTYSSGEVVRWIGSPDSDEPAPQVTLTAAAGHGATAPAAGTAPVERPPAAATGGDDGNGLAVAALTVGALGLAAGLLALGVARRPRGGAATG
ncbi:MAG TPA: YcnI family protein [Solirubrobacteraceae bacterium]|nr:YcnI family protein [Solirubrobacteraceae bacterium]